MDSAMENMIVYAARYAHGRSTGCPLQVVTYIIEEWDNLSEHTKEQLYQESFEAQHCIKDWERLRDKY